MRKNKGVANKILALTSVLVLIMNIIGAYCLIHISGNNVIKTFAKQNEILLRSIAAGINLDEFKELMKYTDEIRSYKDTVNGATESLTTQAQQYSAITEEIASTTEDETEITRAILQISEDLKVAAEHLSETVIEYKL